MDSLCWEEDADEPQPVIELPNGDVWVGSADLSGGRHFRCHLGHVVEVLDNGRLRRVGPGLRPERPWLRVHGPLEAVIKRALRQRGHDASGAHVLHPVHLHDLQHSPPPSHEPRGAVPGHAHAAPHGLLGRLAALWHRHGTAALPGEASAATAAASSGPPWRDTMPWTHPR